MFWYLQYRTPQMHLCLLSLGGFSFPTVIILVLHRWRSSHFLQNLSQTTDSRLLVFLRFIWQLKHFLTLHHCFVFILLFASTVHRKPPKIRALGCNQVCLPTSSTLYFKTYMILKCTSYVCFTINCNTAHPFPNAIIIAFNTSSFEGQHSLTYLLQYATYPSCVY